jgi:oxygen-independent coproporphyrinogen III oxidase
MITTKAANQHKKPAAAPESVYIHIPFCTHKCAFCDFAAFAGLSHLEDEYTDVLCSELHSRLNLAKRPYLQTIFFGGGTPGLMSTKNLGRIMETLRSLADFAPDAEISLETTPHAITAEKAQFWREIGLNRLSIGIESLLDEELTAIGRDHSVGQALAGIEIAATSGMSDISLDFMYGLPTQNLASFGATLDRAISLAQQWPAIQHFSAYCLELSPNSALKSRFPDGHAAYPQDDEQVAMYHQLVDKLAGAGFEQYEVSNFARPGHQSRHNMTYWLNLPYYAFGVGAHRYVDGVRSSNTRSFMKYLREPLQDDQMEIIDAEMQTKEALMLGLRMLKGVDLAAFAADYGVDLLDLRSKEIAMMEAEGLIELSDGKLGLTQKGVPISNSIIATLI